MPGNAARVPETRHQLEVIESQGAVGLKKDRSGYGGVGGGRARSTPVPRPARGTVPQARRARTPAYSTGASSASRRRPLLHRATGRTPRIRQRQLAEPHITPAGGDFPGSRARRARSLTSRDKPITPVSTPRPSRMAEKASPAPRRSRRTARRAGSGRARRRRPRRGRRRRRAHVAVVPAVMTISVVRPSLSRTTCFGTVSLHNIAK